jgi:hypothetical protein
MSKTPTMKQLRDKLKKALDYETRMATGLSEGGKIPTNPVIARALDKTLAKAEVLQAVIEFCEGDPMMLNIMAEN